MLMGNQKTYVVMFPRVCVTNRTLGVFNNISFLEEGFNREYVMADLPEEVAGVWREVFGPQPPPDSEAIRGRIYNSFGWGDDRGKKASICIRTMFVESARVPPLSVNVSSF
jgi:Na+-transporting NADH:ubiquinone oxidoreductase subunit NqrF